MQISAYSTRHEHCPHGFDSATELTRWATSGEPDATVTWQLDELGAHVRQVVGGATTASSKALQRHIADVQRIYSFTVDEQAPSNLLDLGRWATEANAILVADGAVLDAQGRPLLPGPHGEPSGLVPMLTEAIGRAQNVRGWLTAERQVPVPPGLPPVRTASELRPRSADETGLRVIGLVMISDFAASVIAGRPIEPQAMQAVFPQAFAATTPDERRLFESRDPQAARRLQPRIEAAQELLWALSRINISWPQQAAPTDEVKRVVLAGGEKAFLTGLELRPIEDLLNEYECLVSLVAGLDVQQRIGQTDRTTDPTIASQRLSALSWLMNRGLAWDEADSHDRFAG